MLGRSFALNYFAYKQKPSKGERKLFSAGERRSKGKQFPCGWKAIKRNWQSSLGRLTLRWNPLLGSLGSRSRAMSSWGGVESVGVVKTNTQESPVESKLFHQQVQARLTSNSKSANLANLQRHLRSHSFQRQQGH